MSDGSILACRSRAVTWLQPQVERIWSFLRIALMYLITQNPRWKLEIHIQVWWKSAAYIFHCLALCYAITPSEHVFGLHGSCKQVPAVLFQTVPSTQAVFGSFQLHGPKYSVISVRKEELCYRLTPWPFLLCFLSTKSREKNVLPKEFFVWSRKPSHPCQLTSCVILGQRGVVLPDVDMFSNAVEPAMAYLCPHVIRTLLYLSCCSYH